MTVLTYQKIRHTKRLNTLVESSFGLLLSKVTLEHSEFGYKYSIPLFGRPKSIAKELREIADWLEKI